VPHHQSANTSTNNHQPSKVGSSNKNRKQSSSSSSSSSSSASDNSGAGGIGDAASSTSSEPQEYIDFDEIADQPDSILLSFKCPLSDEREVEWRTLLVNGVLYVDIPTSVLPEGSRDSFVSLLEFAEDKLDCSKVFVCFKRARPDRNALMRVFMFLGFTVVPPDYKLCPQNDDIMCMVYNIQ
jgi:ornithine decarboxylase antizyme 1